MDAENNGADDLRELTADIVSAYLSNNQVRPDDIATVINTVHSALRDAGTGARGAPDESKATPPMPWKKAIKPDWIVSFEDGKSYKSMKRHLTMRGMSPEQYREKWGLPPDFPMVAPNYSAARSAMAKKIGLGQKGPAARKRKGRTGP
jgi:predicted transcriptional regulator